MSYKVKTIRIFRKEAKRLIKKYPSLKSEIAELGKQLSNEPETGTPLGNHCFKIRISIVSKGKGKSGGARVISYVYVADETIFLLSIFDKSEKENISEKELEALLKEIE